MSFLLPLEDETSIQEVALYAVGAIIAVVFLIMRYEKRKKNVFGDDFIKRREKKNKTP